MGILYFIRLLSAILVLASLAVLIMFMFITVTIGAFQDSYRDKYIKSIKAKDKRGSDD